MRRLLVLLFLVVLLVAPTASTSEPTIYMIDNCRGLVCPPNGISGCQVVYFC